MNSKSSRTPSVTKKSSSGRPLWRRVVNVLLWIFTIVGIAGLCVSAYGGEVNPASVRGISIIVMTFPLWLLFSIVMLVLDIVLLRKAAALCVLAMIACLPSIWSFTPFNMPKSLTPAEEARSFTLLTYNVVSLSDLTNTYPGGKNPTVEYILATNADIVCLQELRTISPNKNNHLLQSQVDRLHARYPYILLNGRAQMLLSKYPAEPIHTPPPSEVSPHSGEIAAYRLNIEGRTVTLFNVHLQSYYLTPENKALYKEVTNLKAEDRLDDVKSELLGKIQIAAERRATECGVLERFIDHYGGPNVIIAGDFNDVPGCFTLRRLAEHRMREVYPEVGFGPTVTFNRDRFYFRIDHVLYRGAMKPVDIVRGAVSWSDHYPLLVTFVLDPAESKN